MLRADDRRPRHWLARRARGLHGQLSPQQRGAPGRAALEGKAKQSLVAVRYRNCEMELITTCTVAGEYKYLSVTPKTENVKITNADELYARIPIGAVKLEGKLERDGQLNVDMTLVGRYESERLYFKQLDLAGRCEGATHVVTGLGVGAFEFHRVRDDLLVDEATHGGQDLVLEIGEAQGLSQPGHPPTLSNTAARPWPPPMHMVSSP